MTVDREDIIKQLQDRGVDVNPRARTETLLKMLDGGPDTQNDTIKTDQESPKSEDTDMQKLMGMLSTVVSKLDSVDKRLTSVETSGKGDFKLSVKQADVDAASESKSKIDERIVKIVEDILGVDFGVEVLPNPNGPGFLFSVLVPERLSEVKRSTRPLRDPENPNQYLIDTKTKRIVEEEYWPGDRRSRSIGSADSFDVIRDQCNRVRSYIISYYEKNKKPVPEFRLK